MTPDTLTHLNEVILSLVALVGAIAAAWQRIKRGQVEREVQASSELWKARHQDVLASPPTSAHEAQVRAQSTADEIAAEAKAKAKTRRLGPS